MNMNDIPNITREQAEFVRKLRVEGGHTWRSVAGECHDAWNGDWYTNQRAGRDLCYYAAKFFDEDSMKEPWN